MTVSLASLFTTPVSHQSQRFLFSLGSLFCLSVIATADEPPARPQPIAVVNVASMERVLNDIDGVFELAERSEISDLIGGFLGRVHDLKGVDRKRPFGVMVFLDGASIPPRPLVVSYIPVDNIDDLIATVGQGPVKPEPVPGKANRYRLKTPGPMISVAVKEKYVYTCDNAEILEEELPQPETAFNTLTQKYDLALSVRPKNLSPLLKEVFLTFLRTSSEGQLQRRDKESESEYKLRRANGVSTLKLIEQIIGQTEQISLGLDASKEKQSGLVELTIEATPDSEYGKYLKDLGSKPSLFDALVSDQQPFVVRGSWGLDSRERTLAKELLDVAETESINRVDLADTAAPLKKLFESLRATAEKGDLDFCVQFVPLPSQSFVLLGGVKVVGGNNMASGLGEFLTRMKSHGGLQEVQTDIDTHAGVVFHRLKGKDIPDREVRLYGTEPSLYLGASDRILWFAVGGSQALPQLKGAIDKVYGSVGKPTASWNGWPIQLIVRAAPWLELPPGDSDREKQDVRRMQNAFAKQPDALRLDVRPQENGIVTRLQLDAGYLRLLGLAVARRVDRAVKP